MINHCIYLKMYTQFIIFPVFLEHLRAFGKVCEQFFGNEQNSIRQLFKDILVVFSRIFVIARLL